MKLVQFDDGTYGVRKGLIRYRFRDLRSPINYWWAADNPFFKDCKGTLSEAMVVMGRVKHKGINYEDHKPS